jgi:hypothetical protein
MTVWDNPPLKPGDRFMFTRPEWVNKPHYQYECECLSWSPDLLTFNTSSDGHPYSVRGHEFSSYLWRLLERAKPKGSKCRGRHCPEPFNEWAESDGKEGKPEGTHVCWSCRQRGER